MDLRKIKTDLAEIDAHAEGVAMSSTPGSEVNELAYAVHNLVTCVEEIVAQLQGLKG